MDPTATDKNFLDEFDWATREIRLCPNRLWSVTGMDMLKVIPNRKALEGHGGSTVTYHDHEMCTLEFCEFSQRDFTAVQQRHECKGHDCFLLQDLFSRETLRKAAEKDTSTVWSLDGLSMLEHPRPHMAVSHVWSDGTGTGAWADGEVNGCLYGFFRRIALQFQCEGIWWDTICIPKEKAARNRAIRKIQSNYETARITLVHDRFLRNWNWDPKTACFAILMSPWFSRGWTALELAKSRKVKVIFQGRCGLLIKDLDEEILLHDDDSSNDDPRMVASRIIKDLRKPITSVNSLSRILGSRFTSWPKDMAIISALLVDANTHGEMWQQNTYKRVLMKMREIYPGNLFHNLSTMPSVGWCPANLLDMPRADEDTEPQIVTRDWCLIGKWKRIPTTAVKEEKYTWVGIHPLMRRKLEYHISQDTKSWLLIESRSPESSVPRAILVKQLGEQSENYPPSYQFIGTVYFHPALSGEISSAVSEEVKIMGDISPSRDSSKTENEQLGDKSQVSTPDGNASKAEKKQPAEKQQVATQPKSKVHDAIWRGDYERYNDDIETMDLDEPDELGQRLLHLAAERGDRKLVQRLFDNEGMTAKIINARCNLGQSALHRACWGGSVAIVELLLQKDADVSMEDYAGNQPLHIAAEKGYGPIVDRIINNCDCKAQNKNKVTPLHYAAWGGNKRIVEKLLQKGADVKASDKHGWSPLHYAAENGQADVIESLLDKDAEVNIKDSKVGWTPLHFAKFNSHPKVVDILCKRGADTGAVDKCGWTPCYFAALKEQSQSQSKSNLQKKPRKSDQQTAADEDERWTPLHCMVINEGQMVTKLLVDEDCCKTFKDFDIPDDYLNLVNPVDQRFNEGTSRALMWAAGKGYTTVVRLLLAMGDGANSINEWGQTPLYWAAQRGHQATVRLLLEKSDVICGVVFCLICRLVLQETWQQLLNS